MWNRLEMENLWKIWYFFKFDVSARSFGSQAHLEYDFIHIDNAHFLMLQGETNHPFGYLNIRSFGRKLSTTDPGFSGSHFPQQLIFKLPAINGVIDPSMNIKRMKVADLYTEHAKNARCDNEPVVLDLEMVYVKHLVMISSGVPSEITTSSLGIGCSMVLYSATKSVRKIVAEVPHKYERPLSDGAFIKDVQMDLKYTTLHLHRSDASSASPSSLSATEVSINKSYLKRWEYAVIHPHNS
ncbi:hypothetical protein LOAG_11588 [Loa loa]|uniref:Uncharacterized protein n=1 Tax=Loa loa TaxID=7209 RepID=A0A1S0TMS1_LOALO|nr:hypothetical protein LOAG_11588 [Loa loa]EFO16916.1 hypothetical protein LOAG_11588 [Loa loa]